MATVLIPLDDYPVHQTPLPLAQSGGSHPDFYDRFFFNGYTEDTYFALALGVYPNRGVIDAAFSVVRDGVQRSVFTSGPAPADRAHTQVGPIRVEIVEPLRVNRIRVDAPEHGLVADLTFTARTPVCEEPRQTRWSGTRLWMDVTRATALGGWAGRIEVDGAALPVPGAGPVYGTKDRSWGLRPVADPAAAAPDHRPPQVFFLWAPLNFADTALHFLVFEDADGVAWSRTGLRLPVIGSDAPVCDAAAAEPLSIRHAVRWAPGLRRSEGAVLDLGAGPAVRTVELEPLLTFRMAGIGYGHPGYPHGRWHGGPVVAGEVHSCADLDGLGPDQVHVQQVVRARWGDRIGLGVLEQMVVGPHRPSGFTGLLDGAATGAVSGPVPGS